MCRVFLKNNNNNTDFEFDNYVSQDATFPPTNWAQYSASNNKRTTNACKKYNIYQMLFKWIILFGTPQHFRVIEKEKFRIWWLIWRRKWIAYYSPFDSRVSIKFLPMPKNLWKLKISNILLFYAHFVFYLGRISSRYKRSKFGGNSSRFGPKFGINEKNNTQLQSNLRNNSEKIESEIWWEIGTKVSTNPWNDLYAFSPLFQIGN